MSFVVKQRFSEGHRWLAKSGDWWDFTEDVNRRYEFDSSEEAQSVRDCLNGEYVIESTEYQPTTQAKFYKLSQGEYKGYNTYDSCIVVAHSEEEARLIHPRDGSKISYLPGWRDNSWVSKEQTHLLVVEELGIAYDHLKPGTVVMSSFNAG